MLLISDLDNEQRLIDVTHSFAVDVLEVLSQVDHLTVVSKTMLNRAGIKVNILHKVAS